MTVRALEAKSFSGYGGLQQTELPQPQPAKDRVLVRVTAAGVTPLEYTVLSGGHPRAKPPLVLGNEAQVSLRTLAIPDCWWEAA
jgi:NADPH:quinone reductase